MCACNHLRLYEFIRFETGKNFGTYKKNRCLRSNLGKDNQPGVFFFYILALEQTEENRCAGSERIIISKTITVHDNRQQVTAANSLKNFDDRKPNAYREIFIDTVRISKNERKTDEFRFRRAAPGTISTIPCYQYLITV